MTIPIRIAWAFYLVRNQVCLISALLLLFRQVRGITFNEKYKNWNIKMGYTLCRISSCDWGNHWSC